MDNQTRTANQHSTQKKQAHNINHQANTLPQQSNPTVERLADPSHVSDLKPQIRNDQLPAISIGEAIASAGRSGEHNLVIEWIDVWVGNNKPCRFNIRTLSSNDLEVIVEQAAYRKIYAGTGTVSTLVIPVAPIGTKGKLIVNDLATGETIERPWVWLSLGQLGFLSRIWTAIKRSLWKSAN